MGLPMLKKYSLAAFTMLALYTPLAFAAVDESSYESGHGALQRFSSGAGIAATPLWVQIWLILLGATFLSSLFFVRKHPIARWAIGGILVSVPLTPVIVRSLGWPFLGGAIALGHLVFWSPALFLLLTRRPFLDEANSPAFRFWAIMMTSVIIISFVFDIRDTAIYLRHVLG